MNKFRHINQEFHLGLYNIWVYIYLSQGNTDRFKVGWLEMWIDFFLFIFIKVKKDIHNCKENKNPKPIEPRQINYWNITKYNQMT